MKSSGESRFSGEMRLDLRALRRWRPSARIPEISARLLCGDIVIMLKPSAESYSTSLMGVSVVLVSLREENGKQLKWTANLMAAKAPKYLPLRTIVNDWAGSTGEPALLIVRRIGEWAIMDGFASDAFIHQNGTVISRIDIYASCMAVADSSPSSNGRWNADVAERASVSSASVVEFCKSNDVALPRCLAEPARFTWRSKTPRNDAPPPCAGAGERVKQMEAGERAEGWMDTMTAILCGEEVGFMGSRRTAHTISFHGAALDRWSSYRIMTQGYIDQSKQPGLQDRLDALDRGWEDASQKLPAEQSSVPKAAAGSDEPKKVKVGRPKGRAYQMSDDKILSEMKEAHKKEGGSIASIADQFAERAKGGGTAASRSRRLSTAFLKDNPR
jgi:hypothetical protein